MEIQEIIYRNFMVLSRKYNADTPNKLKIVLKCSKQHASALINKVSPIGKLTITKLAKAWGISPEDFYKEDIENNSATPPVNDSVWALKAFEGLEKQIELLKIGVKSLDGICSGQRTDIESIEARLEEAATTGKIVKLRKAG